MSVQAIDVGSLQAKKCGHCQRTLQARPNFTFGQDPHTGKLSSECMECEGRRKVTDPAYGFELLEREIGTGTIAAAIRALWDLSAYAALVSPHGMLGPGGECHYCGGKLTEWGHGHKLDRIDRGKPWLPANVAACCQPCMVDRGALTVAEWRKLRLDETVRRYGRGCVPWENVLRGRCPPKVRIPNLRDYTVAVREAISSPLHVANDVERTTPAFVPPEPPPAPINKMQTIVTVLREHGPMTREDLYEEVAAVLDEDVTVAKRHISANLCQLRSPSRLTNRILEVDGLFMTEEQAKGYEPAAAPPPEPAPPPAPPAADHCLIVTLCGDDFTKLAAVVAMAGKHDDESALEAEASKLIADALARAPKGRAEVLLRLAYEFVAAAEGLESFGFTAGPLVDAMRALVAEGKETAEAYLAGRIAAASQEPVEVTPPAPRQRVVDNLPACAIALAELLNESGSPSFKASAFAGKLGKENGRGIAPILMALRGRGWIDKGTDGQWVIHVEPLAEYMTAMAAEQQEEVAQ